MGEPSQADMSVTPLPPCLLIREGEGFWVEEGPPSEISVTLQALEEGCFRDAWCYDATGRLWPIVASRLKEQPSFLQRLLPWRQFPVEIQFGTPSHLSMSEVISRLARVLRSDNAFCDYFRASPVEILNRFEAARTPGDIIQVARDPDPERAPG